MNRTYEAVQATLAPEMRAVESPSAVLETAAALWPDRRYMAYGPTGERFTFADVNQRADAFAAALDAAGVERGDRVGVYLTNGPAFVFAAYACSRLGAVQTPINWQYREREVAHALDTAGISTILLEPDPAFVEIVAALAPGAPALESVVVLGDSIPDPLAALDDTAVRRLSDLEAAGGRPPAVETGWDDPAAILYTSGTTGLPKPALLANRSYVLAAKSFLGAPLPDGDVNYNPYPLFHANNQFYSMLGPAINGSGYVLSDTFSASSFWEEVRDNDVTSFNILGGVPKIMEAAFDPDEIPDNDLQLAIGPIGTEGWRSFEETFDLDVVQIYSQTESLTLLMNHPDPDRIRLGSIGKPMFPDLGHEVTLVDEDGAVIDGPGTGELTRSDPAAMLEYFEQPEKTGETLREGVIHSGDVVRRDADGYLYYVDRRKFMIRRSGENIAPREVENVIDELAGVEESAVIPVPDDVRGEEVKALVNRVDGGVTERDVVRQVARNLAAYKVPRYVEFRTEFPRTPSERIKRVQLAEAEADRADFGWDRDVAWPAWERGG